MSDKLGDELVAVVIQTASYRNPIDVAGALMPVIRAHLAQAWDDGWEMRETARLHGREGDNHNPWREAKK